MGKMITAPVIRHEIMSLPNIQTASGTGITASASVRATAAGLKSRLRPVRNRMPPPPPITALPGRLMTPCQEQIAIAGNERAQPFRRIVAQQNDPLLTAERVNALEQRADSAHVQIGQNPVQARIRHPFACPVGEQQTR